MSKKPSSVSIATANLKKGFSSPASKIAIVCIVFLIVSLAGLGFKKISNKSTVKLEKSSASGFSTDNANVTGEIADTETLGVIEKQMTEESHQTLARGESNLGAFVFETHKVVQLNIKDGFNENSVEGGTGPVMQEAQIVAALRERAAALNRIDLANQRPESSANQQQSAPTGGATATASYSNQGSGTYAYSAAQTEQLNGSMVDAQGKPFPYGVTVDDATQITKQLAAAGRLAVTYKSLANGLLSGQQQSNSNQTISAAGGGQRPSANPPSSAASNDVVRAGGSLTNPNAENKRLVAEAGAICPAKSESAINTDYPLPAFFEILSCKDLTGVRVRGTIQETADNFVINFTGFFPTAAHPYKFAGQPEGVSMDINNGGYAGVASDVDNHFLSRIFSASLLSLANTEKEFLSQRGSSTVTTGTSSTVAVEPMSDKDKNNARVAGVLSGSMDVITKDTQYGVNRKATKKLEMGAVIGIQFMSNIEVIDDRK